MIEIILDIANQINEKVVSSSRQEQGDKKKRRIRVLSVTQEPFFKTTMVRLEDRKAKEQYVAQGSETLFEGVVWKFYRADGRLGRYLGPPLFSIQGSKSRKDLRKALKGWVKAQEALPSSHSQRWF